MKRPLLALAGPPLIAVFTLVGCGPDATPRSDRAVPGGDAARGRMAIRAHGCGACHVIPGVREARGIVGPSLANLSLRLYLAGTLLNDASNLIAWIRDPRALAPGTVMPRLGVSDADARDIAAYLYGAPGARLRSGPER